MADPIPIRASSVAGIIDCPLRGLSIQLGLVKQLPSTAPACIGSAVHGSTAAFDKAVVSGNPISAYDASEIAEDYIRHPPEEVNWGGMTEKQALTRALGVHTRYCSDISGLMVYEHVELPLAELVVDVDGVGILLTGTLDRIYSDGRYKQDGGKRGITDLKSGARACSQKPGKHKAQIGVYELLAEHTLGVNMGLPGVIVRLQTSNDYEVDQVAIPDARAALLGTDKQVGLLQHIGHMLKTGDWYGNSSSYLCSDKYCPLFDGCIFK
jgi:hypothetical protein